MKIGGIENHRRRENGVLVYPVYSRRSKGLSVGINLFPDRKVCSFNCPYCEVFPFETEQKFSLTQMKDELEKAIAEAEKNRVPLRDICFSGSGEPSMSPFFPSALESAFAVRDSMAKETPLVLITNGTGLLDEKIFALLAGAASKNNGLDIWLKLDAGTESWYKAMSRSDISFARLVEMIKDFVRHAPVTLQTMLCKIDGKSPDPEETRAWESLAAELALGAIKLRRIQIYGKARAAPEDPLAEALPLSFLEERAASLKDALALAGKDIPVEVYI